MIKRGLLTAVMIFMFAMVLFPLSASANNDNRTLQDLIDELNVLRDNLNRVQNEQTQTEQEIKQTQANISRINREIMEMDKDIENLIKEIEQLEIDIREKDEEMKRVINQHQLSNGNNAYIEYVVGASTVTDFIFRLAIVEQITEYNKNMIDTMNDMIEESNRKTAELEGKKVASKNQRASLYSEQLKLGRRSEELNEHEMSLADEISDARKTIENYEKYFNCKPHQRLKDCTRFPLDVSFVRPLEKGFVTSDFGWRTNPLTGVGTRFHSGMDIGGNAVGTNVYPVAVGRVVLVGYNRCGGNYVIVQHSVNGKYYASRYLHLSRVNVRTGQEVRRETPIGGIGGADLSVDICSTGAHLHFDIAQGIYGQDFISFSSTGPVINPRNVLQFPRAGRPLVWFYGRF